jgi:Uma2 family endonuclease
MTVATKFPITLEERLELGPDIVRFDATWQEYLALLAFCDYQIEYDNQQIILMSIASDPHETIVSQIIACLVNALVDEPEFTVKGSNRHIFIPEFQKDYAPDAHVVNGEPAIHVLRKGSTANTNPWLVVEVLSPGTYVRDWNEKMPLYKQIPSLQHIVYIEQEHPFVSVYSRVGESVVWENIDYHKMEDSFSLNGKSVLLRDIYNKVIFADKAEKKRSNGKKK